MFPSFTPALILTGPRRQCHLLPLVALPPPPAALPFGYPKLSFWIYCRFSAPPTLPHCNLANPLFLPFSVPPNPVRIHFHISHEILLSIHCLVEECILTLSTSEFAGM
ncbi:hypothetical protein HOY80DRAFT_583348 [Tuber brumale]|nr:hypothetical protein HOY80DRAFT_583348 [Tuber brumale]